jgi:uncharacterized phiE125 gp8 family phage protein
MNVVTQPTTEPISLEEARLHCRVDAEGSPPAHPDDPILEALITAVREWTEQYLGRALAPQTIEEASDAFPAEEFTLSYGPVLGVESIYYTDDEIGVLMVDPATYVLNTQEYPVRVLLNDGFEWPTASTTVASNVRIRYLVGYSTPGTSPQDAPLPKAVKQGMLLLLAFFYKNREAATVVDFKLLPLGYCMLMSPWRLNRGFA